MLWQGTHMARNNEMMEALSAIAIDKGISER
jgi:hypothetical protein